MQNYIVDLCGCATWCLIIERRTEAEVDWE